MLGKRIPALGVVGLTVIAAQRLIGVVILDGMTSLDEIFIIIGNICIFLLKYFPC